MRLSTKRAAPRRPFKCPCGSTHYFTDPVMQQSYEAVTRGLDDTILVTVGKRQYQVSRIYIAFHGIKARELSFLAKKLPDAVRRDK